MYVCINKFVCVHVCVCVCVRACMCVCVCSIRGKGTSLAAIGVGASIVGASIVVGTVQCCCRPSCVSLSSYA